MNTDQQANSSAALKKADTNPFGMNSYHPRRRFWPRIVAISILIIAAVGLTFIFKLLPLKNKINERLAVQLQVNEITALETVARQEQKKLLEIFTNLAKESGINASGWDFSAPTPEQLRLLQQHEPETGELLATYIAKRDECIFLKQRVHDLEVRLGTPRLVVPGDTHFQMAYDFLISQTGSPDEEIRRVLQQTRLQEPLLPGFKVWNFWLADGFYTFVTQGDAPLTPEEATRQALEKQRQEKEQAVAGLNSIFLIIGTLEDLQAKQILIGGFLKSTRLGEIPAAAFRQTMDLRNQRDIRIQARELKLRKIVRVALFPKEFIPDIDYGLQISPQGRWAKVTIRKTNVFRGRRIVIAVE